MKIHLFPQEHAALELMQDLSTELVQSVSGLAEIMGEGPAGKTQDDGKAADGVDSVLERLHAHEARGAELHYALLTRLRSSFLSPLPREDLYELSRRLLTAIERVDSVGELIRLHHLQDMSSRGAEQLEILVRQADLTQTAVAGLQALEELAGYWIDMISLARRARRTHNRWLSELPGRPDPAQAARERDIAGQLHDAASAIHDVAAFIGTIAVRES